MSNPISQYLALVSLNSVQSTLKYETDAVTNLFNQYQQDEFAINNIIQSITIMYNTIVANNGKIVITGVGKSYKLGLKLVATLNSLSIQSSSLHPTEALHGDLGLIDQNRDCLIMVTSSGNTPELIQLLPHLSSNLPILLLTCSKNSKLSQYNQINSLILAELLSCHKEEIIHGIPAPTVSFTLSMMLADAVILALLELIETDSLKRKKLFGLKHPGGSIGANLAQQFNQNNTSRSGDNTITTTTTNTNTNNNTNNNSSITVQAPIIPPLNLMSATTSTTTTRLSSNSSSMLSLKEMELESYSSVDDTDERGQAQKSFKEITYQDLLKLQELSLLQWIVRYDSIRLIETDNKGGSSNSSSSSNNNYVSCDFIQSLYKKHYDGLNWDKFKWELIKKFT